VNSNDLYLQIEDMLFRGLALFLESKESKNFENIEENLRKLMSERARNIAMAYADRVVPPCPDCGSEDLAVTARLSCHACWRVQSFAVGGGGSGSGGGQAA
jgi:hypothetical protein